MGYPSVSYHGSVECSRERVVGGFYAPYDGVSQENVYNLLFFHVAYGRGNFPAFDDIPLGKRVRPFILGLIYIFNEGIYFSLIYLFLIETLLSDLFILEIFYLFLFLVMARNTKFVHVREISFLYSTEDMFNKFLHNIRFSSIGKEKDVIMEHYSQEERDDMETYDDPSTLFFYFDFPVIYELGVLVPFSFFRGRVLNCLEFAPFPSYF